MQLLPFGPRWFAPLLVKNQNKVKHGFCALFIFIFNNEFDSMKRLIKFYDVGYLIMLSATSNNHYLTAKTS